jgi:DNA-binding NarL/FixJ family response regulator
MRKVLILDNDPRTAAYFGQTFERMRLQVVHARSLLEVGPHLIVPPPNLLVMNVPRRDALEYLEFASSLRANRGTACVFVLERLDHDTASALAEIGERSVLCKPIHREQLEATCTIALKEQEKAGVQPEAARSETSPTRERHLEKTLRRIADAVAVAGIAMRTESYGVVKFEGLRPREEEIVRLLLQHVRVPAIAQRLGINQQTVRNHLKGAFKRTGVRSQQELLDHFAGAVRGQA